MRIMFASAVLVATQAAGCVIDLRGSLYKASNSFVVVQQGEQVTVLLENIAGTGASWMHNAKTVHNELDTIIAEVVTPQEEDVLSESQDHFAGGLEQVSWTFEAMDVGHFHLDMALARAWEFKDAFETSLEDEWRNLEATYDSRTLDFNVVDYINEMLVSDYET